MPLMFPIGPATNDTFSFSGRSYRYNGVAWVAAGFEPSSSPGVTVLNGRSPTFAAWYETLVQTIAVPRVPQTIQHIDGPPSTVARPARDPKEVNYL